MRDTCRINIKFPKAFYEFNKNDLVEEEHSDVCLVKVEQDK